ncbi:MAG: hypothetical protein ABI323_09995 [Solirubrobacteraceae bacterium]
MSNLRRSRLRTLVLTAAATLTTVGVMGAQTASGARGHAAGARTIHVIEHTITDTENPGVGGADAKGNSSRSADPNGLVAPPSWGRHLAESQSGPIPASTASGGSSV